MTETTVLMVSKGREYIKRYGPLTAVEELQYLDTYLQGAKEWGKVLEDGLRQPVKKTEESHA